MLGCVEVLERGKNDATVHWCRVPDSGGEKRRVSGRDAAACENVQWRLLTRTRMMKRSAVDVRMYRLDGAE